MGFKVGEYGVAETARKSAQKNAYQAIENLQSADEYRRKLQSIEVELFGWGRKNLEAVGGYNTDYIFTKDEFGKNLDETLTYIYDDISGGMDPLESLSARIVKHDIPEELKDVLVKRAKERYEFEAGIVNESKPFTQYPNISEEDLQARFELEKIVKTNTNEATDIIETKTPPAKKPIVGQPADIATSVGGNPVPKQGQPVVAKPTPPRVERYVPQTAEEISARVEMRKALSKSSISSSVKSSAKRLPSGRSIAEQVVKGTKNSNNIRTAGIAALLGIAGLGYSRMRNGEEERNKKQY